MESANHPQHDSSIPSSDVPAPKPPAEYIKRIRKAKSFPPGCKKRLYSIASIPSFCSMRLTDSSPRRTPQNRNTLQDGAQTERPVRRPAMRGKQGIQNAHSFTEGATDYPFEDFCPTPTFGRPGSTRKEAKSTRLPGLSAHNEPDFIIPEQARFRLTRRRAEVTLPNGYSHLSHHQAHDAPAANNTRLTEQQVNKTMQHWRNSCREQSSEGSPVERRIRDCSINGR